MSFFTFCQVSFLFFFFFFCGWHLASRTKKNLEIAVVLRGPHCVCVCRYACMHLTRQALNGPAKPTPSSLVSHLCLIMPALLIPTPPKPCYLPPAPTPLLYSPASTLGEQSKRKCDNGGISQMYIQLARVNAVLSHCAAL